MLCFVISKNSSQSLTCKHFFPSIKFQHLSLSPTMSTPAEYYNSLPPVSKAYGVACLMTSAAYYLQLYDPWNIALDYALVFKRLQVWRLVTNFFFLGPFSFRFAIRLIMIAKYGVSLEKGPFDKRTADYLWMFIFGALSLLVIGGVPFCRTPFMGVSVVYMITYVWGREFPNARIKIYGVVYLKGFYLPWAVLGLDLIFGNPLKPGLIGMVAGHLYYFLTVLHPLSGGKFILKTPLWVHKIVAYWGEGSQMNAPVQSNPTDGIVFRGRSFRVGGSGSQRSTRRSSEEQTEEEEEESINNSNSPQRRNQVSGIAFRGRSRRLNE